MSLSEVHVVRTIKPAKGKAHLVRALVKALVPAVEKSEPGVLKYQFLITQEGTIVAQETYENAQAALEHIMSDYFFDFHKKLSEGNLLAVPIETQFVTHLVGFGSRT